MRNEKAHERRHHGRARITRHSRTRVVLTVSFALSPVIGLSCHRRLAELFPAKLDASVGASGPHDFAVRFKHARRCAPFASTASRPASVTCATPLCWGGMGRACRDDLPDGESGIFFAGRLDDPNHVDPVQQIRVYAQDGKARREAEGVSGGVNGGYASLTHPTKAKPNSVRLRGLTRRRRSAGPSARWLVDRPTPHSRPGWPRNWLRPADSPRPRASHWL